jgi:hypothetical protein
VVAVEAGEDDEGDEEVEQVVDVDAAICMLPQSFLMGLAVAWM